MSLTNMHATKINLIIESKPKDLVGEVVNYLEPASDPLNEDNRKAARTVLAKMMDEFYIRCPMCDASLADAANMCFGDNCPVTP